MINDCVPEKSIIRDWARLRDWELQILVSKGYEGAILEHRDRYLREKALRDNRALIEEEIEKAGNRSVGLRVAADRLERQLDTRTGMPIPENIEAAKILRESARGG